MEYRLIAIMNSGEEIELAKYNDLSLFYTIMDNLNNGTYINKVIIYDDVGNLIKEKRLNNSKILVKKKEGDNYG